MGRVSIDPTYLPDPTESLHEAVQRQRAWAGLVREEPLPHPPATLAAVDVHLGNDRAIAVAALVSYPGLEQIALVTAEGPLAYPYIPGLLSWREGPAAPPPLGQLPAAPGVLIAGGRGRGPPPPFRPPRPPRPPPHPPPT